MSLAGFKASNHPQQTAKHGARDDVDDRGTDPAFIATLEERFGPFDLDVAAAAHNAKAPKFYTREDNGLTQPWPGLVWCNPPYSDCGAWVRKAWDEWNRPLQWLVECPACPGVPATVELNGRTLGSQPMREGRWCPARFVAKQHRLCHQRRGEIVETLLVRQNSETIVMLLPANRVEQKWWQEQVEPFRDRPDSPLRVEFLPGRMRFDRPGWTPGPKGDRPPFGCCLLIWGGKA